MKSLSQLHLAQLKYQYCYLQLHTSLADAAQDKMRLLLLQQTVDRRAGVQEVRSAMDHLGTAQEQYAQLLKVLSIEYDVDFANVSWDDETGRIVENKELESA